MSLSSLKLTLICICAGLFMLALLMHVSQAKECDELAHYIGANCSSSSSDSWDPTAELDNMGTSKAGQQGSSTTGVNWAKVSRQYRWNQPVSAFDNNSGSENGQASTSKGKNTTATITKSTLQPANKTAEKTAQYIEPKRSSRFYTMAAPLSNLSQYDVVLDVSDGASKFIPGSVHINYLNFQNNGTLRPASELANILGNAGISRNDSVLIYGECECGLGPSVSTYAYWIMRYLGHDPKKVKILDGNVASWAAANHSVTNKTKTLPKKIYSFDLHPEYLATYDEAKSDQVRVIDSRMPQDFGADSILGSNNLPFNQFISNNRLKDETVLQKMLQGYPKNKPVVVYSNEGVEASLAWFSLEVMGYQAKLYTWQDWTEHNK